MSAHYKPNASTVRQKLRPIYRATKSASVGPCQSFPQEAIVGSLGKLARTLADGTEVPEEFYFVCGLTILGSLCASQLRIKTGIEVETRLYSVIIGESYAVKKTTAIKRIIQFFEESAFGCQLKTLYGVGSAEELARELRRNPQLVLAYDELRSFVDKCNVQNSALLPMAASLFETRNWDNSTKQSTQKISIRNAQLSLLGAGPPHEISG